MLSIHAFDLKYQPFIFLYIDMFIVMNQNPNSNGEKQLGKKCDSD